MYIADGYATLVLPAGKRLTTCRLHVDRYVKIDDGRNYPQLCANGSRHGNTLIYHSDEHLARDCNAKLYKTKAGFEREAERLLNIDPEWL